MDETDTRRWSIGGYARVYSWPQCKYCGSAVTGRDCARTECLLCGNAQCFRNGAGNGQCKICYHGFLPGWSRTGSRMCGRTGCFELAISAAPRVGQVCAVHAATTKIRHRGVFLTLAELAAAQTAELDAGRLSVGLEKWQLIL